MRWESESNPNWRVGVEKDLFKLFSPCVFYKWFCIKDNNSSGFLKRFKA